MSPVEILGTAILWVVGCLMTLAFPFTEFARGMATNPSAFSPSKGGCLISLLGLALLAWLITS
jgi:hypothetical protein